MAEVTVLNDSLLHTHSSASCQKSVPCFQAASACVAAAAAAVIVLYAAVVATLRRLPTLRSASFRPVLSLLTIIGVVDITSLLLVTIQPVLQYVGGSVNADIRGVIVTAFDVSTFSIEPIRYNITLCAAVERFLVVYSSASQLRQSAQSSTFRWQRSVLAAVVTGVLIGLTVLFTKDQIGPLWSYLSCIPLFTIFVVEYACYGYVLRTIHEVLQRVRTRRQTKEEPTVDWSWKNRREWAIHKRVTYQLGADLVVRSVTKTATIAYMMVVIPLEYKEWNFVYGEKVWMFNLVGPVFDCLANPLIYLWFTKSLRRKLVHTCHGLFCCVWCSVSCTCELSPPEPAFQHGCFTPTTTSQS